MADKNKQPTKEEIEQAKASARNYALRNLKAENLVNLAVAYNAQSKNSGFGENDNAAVDEFLYFPAMSSGTKFYDTASGKEYDLMKNAFLAARGNGPRYSESVRGYDLIENASKIITESLTSVKVSDILALAGSKAPVKEAYKDKYIADLLQSGKEEDKKVASTMIGVYMSYLTTNGVSRALDERAKTLRSGLEEIVKPEEKIK